MIVVFPLLKERKHGLRKRIFTENVYTVSYVRTTCVLTKRELRLMLFGIIMILSNSKRKNQFQIKMITSHIHKCDWRFNH